MLEVNTRKGKKSEYHYQMKKTKVKIVLKQSSTDMGKSEYDMLRNIKNG